MLERDRNQRKWKTIILLAAALLVCLPVASFLANPATYRSTFAAIDAKISDVMTLSAACTLVSSGITALKDDFGTPIATQLAEYTDYLLVIMSILLTEKYLLTILAWVTCRLAIPACFVSSIPYLAEKWPALRGILLRVTALLVSLYLVIPISMGFAGMISRTFEISFDETVLAANQLFETEGGAQKADASIWEKMTDTVNSAADTITQLPGRAAELMNRFVQTIAIMIVTSCVIPMLSLVVVLRISKIITNGILPPPPPKHRIVEERKETRAIE